MVIEYSHIKAPKKINRSFFSFEKIAEKRSNQRGEEGKVEQG